ncbi:Halotolerance protein HAL2 [Purpureocillium lavendulum]|uniref:Halotolerance protein HAL2 n=1 Tax=Purpureocillium lavendulum TaxID=1247861 RepID=A0AB34FUA4_9HYPO|nr:Halotolerance protein HAL2 [Purpureocillium lavendulum]
MPSLVAASVEPPRAPHVIGPKQRTPMRPSAVIPQQIVDEARAVPAEQWNPEKHVAPKTAVVQHLMKDFGLEGKGISPVAVTDPFPLFTDEAILQIRREIFSEPVLRDCRFKSDFNANMIRGMGHERAPFTYDAWWSPEILDMISEAAGVELVPAFDYEIANVNISINDQNTTEIVTYGDETSAVAWHYDSFPFVCVTMAADCTGMVGGETAIKLPNGEERRVRGPAMGTCVVMQGRYIQHQALKAFGGRERIALVTAFRPKSPFVRDESILTGCRVISHLSELYPQYIEYRLSNLEERFRRALQEEKRRQVQRKEFNVSAMRAFLLEQLEYIQTSLDEVYIPEADFIPLDK